KKPTEQKPAELIVVDVEAVKEAGRVALDRTPVGWASALKGSAVYVLLPRPDAKAAPGGTATLVSAGIADGATKNLVIQGDASDLAASPDGKLLYVLDKGKPSGKAEKNVNGRLHVISAESFSSVATLDAGSGPHELLFEPTSSTFLILSEAAPVKGGD